MVAVAILLERYHKDKVIGHENYPTLNSEPSISDQNLKPAFKKKKKKKTYANTNIKDPKQNGKVKMSTEL